MSLVDFLMENKTFLNKISHSICMQRYNSVIECKRAKKCYLEIGDKWIFSTHGQNFRGRVSLHGNKQVFSFYCW